jgi:hypothetical protein
MEEGTMAETIRPDESAVSAIQATPVSASLARLREQVMPILEAVKHEYAGRFQPGYPVLVDSVERGGFFGIALDPGYGLYFVSDGERLYAELEYISERGDALADASKEKFAGKPVFERIEVQPGWPVRWYRDLVARLLARWNTRQTRLFMTDS